MDDLEKLFQVFFCFQVHSNDSATAPFQCFVVSECLCRFEDSERVGFPRHIDICLIIRSDLDENTFLGTATHRWNAWWSSSLQVNRIDADDSGTWRFTLDTAYRR